MKLLQNSPRGWCIFGAFVIERQSGLFLCDLDDFLPMGRRSLFRSRSGTRDLFCEHPVARSGQKFSELLNVTSFHKRLGLVSRLFNVSICVFQIALHNLDKISQGKSDL